MKKRLIFLLLSAFLAPLTTKAQERTIQNGGDLEWLHYYGQAKLNQKWKLWADGSYRRKDGLSEMSQFVSRVELGYHLTSDVEIAGGVAVLGFYAADTLGRLEVRPTQDFIFKQKLGNVNFQNRVRIEERFVKTVGIADSYEFNWRFRYGFNFLFPIAQLSEKKPDLKLAFSFGDEVFINAGKNIVYNFFDQNRLMFGPVLQFNPDLSLGFIYNWQFRATTTPAKYVHDHVIWIQIRQKLDFSKSK